MIATVILTAWLAAPQARAGVAFTNLVFFTYTNAPNYGAWNITTPGHTSALVQGNDGNFYGTTYCGGFNGVGYSFGQTGLGTVFKMAPNGTFTSLYSFGSVLNGDDYPLDGYAPSGNLIKGVDGNIYGTTYYGGNNSGPSEATSGTIFEITDNGALATLYTFGHNLGWNTNADINAWTNTDGENPVAGLVQDSAGNFYGTTSGDGAYSGGTIFQFTSGGALNTLYSFPNFRMDVDSLDGDTPLSELTEGSDGNFYGSTSGGGTNYSGTIFRITPDGTFTVLCSFHSSQLLLGKDGNFYGTANSSQYGQIFQMTTNGVITILHTFNSADGSYPNGLIQGSDGNLYGTTQSGGVRTPDGAYPGTVFQMTTNGTFTTLYSFSGPDGDGCQSALVQGTDGSFYGTTSYGGTLWYDPLSTSYGNLGHGTIFKLTIMPVFQTIMPTNGSVALTWNIMPGQKYQLQSNTNLSSTNWLNLGSSATASTATVSASDSMTNSQCFYRIMLVQ
jgi:uncharacterized repeat protein (TIGR03803 family)